MTLFTESPDLDHLAQYFIKAFPIMDRLEQRQALRLYALLAEGQPVAIEHLAQELIVSAVELKTLLDSWGGVFYDDLNRVIGFWGLSTKEMKHRITVKGKTVFTWCAWDALFIPELLNATVNMTSQCATTRKEIRLTISPNAIESRSQQGIMVSFLTPAEEKFNENVTTSFCHYVHFFVSSEAGEQWVASHEGSFLLSLNDAFWVGKKMNATRYEQSLATVQRS